MPYIEEFSREGAEILPTTAGELSYNFAITVKEYLLLKKESYQTYTEIIGALEATKLEIYRRLVAKYEDFKIKTNGDVF